MTVMDIVKCRIDMMANVDCLPLLDTDCANDLHFFHHFDYCTET